DRLRGNSRNRVEWPISPTVRHQAPAVPPFSAAPKRARSCPASLPASASSSLGQLATSRRLSKPPPQCPLGSPRTNGKAGLSTRPFQTQSYTENKTLNSPDAAPQT